MIRREKSIPLFAASTPMSPNTTSSSSRMNSGGASCTERTSAVDWAVRATIALMPWQPSAANAFRSAWIPAPPPESEPAIVRQRGITAAEASIGPVAIVTWDELLQGGELAYRTEIPAQHADIVAIPDGLHPRVLDSLSELGLEGLYRHQAEAFHAAERGEHIVVS